MITKSRRDHVCLKFFTSGTLFVDSSISGAGNEQCKVCGRKKDLQKWYGGKHEDYIPKQYLPTFSSHPIELNMHRIRGLSEQFVYFNDDTFIINKMEPEDFFRNGLPRDYCIETALVQDDINNPFACILMNNAALVNMHYSKREVIGRNWKNGFILHMENGNSEIC